MAETIDKRVEVELADITEDDLFAGYSSNAKNKKGMAFRLKNILEKLGIVQPDADSKVEGAAGKLARFTGKRNIQYTLIDSSGETTAFMDKTGGKLVEIHTDSMRGLIKLFSDTLSGYIHIGVKGLTLNAGEDKPVADLVTLPALSGNKNSKWRYSTITEPGILFGAESGKEHEADIYSIPVPVIGASWGLRMKIACNKISNCNADIWAYDGETNTILGHYYGAFPTITYVPIDIDVAEGGTQSYLRIRVNIHPPNMDIALTFRDMSIYSNVNSWRAIGCYDATTAAISLEEDAENETLIVHGENDYKVTTEVVPDDPPSLIIVNQEVQDIEEIIYENPKIKEGMQALVTFSPYTKKLAVMADVVEEGKMIIRLINVGKETLQLTGNLNIKILS